MDILREENLIFQDFFFFFFGGAGWWIETELGKGRLSYMATNSSVSFGDELRIMPRVRRRVCCTIVHFTRNLRALPGWPGRSFHWRCAVLQKDAEQRFSAWEMHLASVDANGGCWGLWRWTVLCRGFRRDLLGLRLEPLSPARTCLQCSRNQGPGCAWMRSDIKGSPPP